MKNIFGILILILSSYFSQSQSINIFLVTGGHAYDTVQFFEMFDSFDNVNYTHILQPKANQMIAENKVGQFDVLVFYDMWNEIDQKQKDAYFKLASEGKPFLFLHHSLASYPAWDGFSDLIGGKYIFERSALQNELSTFQHDVWVNVKIDDKNHPVTKGISDFRIFDEVYGDFFVKKGVHKLLTTNHPQSGKIIGWENRFKESNIVYLQLGHDSHAFQSLEFRKLIIQSIKYLNQE